MSVICRLCLFTIRFNEIVVGDENDLLKKSLKQIKI